MHLRPGRLDLLRRHLRAARSVALFVVLLVGAAQAAAFVHGHDADHQPEHTLCAACLALNGGHAALPGRVPTPLPPVVPAASTAIAVLDCFVPAALRTPAVRAPPAPSCQ